MTTSQKRSNREQKKPKQERPKLTDAQSAFTALPFTVAAPDARPVRKLRGHKAPLAPTLPPDLIEAVDVIAAEEDRSRAKMIELMLRSAVEQRAVWRNAA